MVKFIAHVDVKLWPLHNKFEVNAVLLLQGSYILYKALKYQLYTLIN